MNDHLAKAHLLFDAGRYDKAVEQLRAGLAQDPEDGPAQALFALCLAKMPGHEKEAIAAARRATAVAPEDPAPHRVLANLLYYAEDYGGAREAVDRALQLNPTDANSHGLRAGLLLQDRRWKEALAAAEAGLACDAENELCLNMRGVTLSTLQRGDEAAEAIDEALAADPESSPTHITKGWLLLASQDYEQAGRHFKEALRQDPEAEEAREGLGLVLKARNPIYRAYMRYTFWMSRQGKRAVWGYVIGGYVLFRILRGFARSNPEWEPYLWPVILLYGSLMLLTWVSEPIFNSLLRLNEMGRLYLTAKQIRGSNAFLGFLAPGVLMMVAGGTTGQNQLVLGGFMCAFMALPASVALGHESDRARRKLIPWVIVLACLAVGAAVTLDLGETAPVAFLTLWVVGNLAFQFYASKLSLDT